MFDPGLEAAALVLARAAIVGLAALGAYRATRPAMALGFVGKFTEAMATQVLKRPSRWARLQVWLAKPLGTCPRCMVSTWGLASLWAVGQWPPDPVHLVPVLLIGCGLQEWLDQ